jgi:hypothetical protein
MGVVCGMVDHGIIWMHGRDISGIYGKIPTPNKTIPTAANMQDNITKNPSVS